MNFELLHTDPGSSARAGLISTDHGTIETPIFMPVGTVGSVKGVFHRDLADEAGAQIILGNTYHLYLRPGTDILERAGGLHRFCSWDRPILTDSGGFQVFSLAGCRKLSEEGCRFSSHIDGSKHLFTPEGVIDIQRSIGADIMMAFDECPPGDAPYDYAARSLDLTCRWLERCFDRYRQTEPKYGHYQSLFPIVQGCTYPDLRTRSAEFVRQFDADGYAIGGLAVGEPAPVMYEMIGLLDGLLPRDKPRYLMGVGTPANLLEGIEPCIGVTTTAIKDTLNDSQPIPVTIEKILNEVARTYNVMPSDIRGKKRNANVSAARQMTMYIIREVTGMSMEAIGQEFQRDHSTVVYSIKTMEENIKRDQHLKEMCSDIMKNVRT